MIFWWVGILFLAPVSIFLCATPRGLIRDTSPWKYIFFLSPTRLWWAISTGSRLEEFWGKDVSILVGLALCWTGFSTVRCSIPHLTSSIPPIQPICSLKAPQCYIRLWRVIFSEVKSAFLKLTSGVWGNLVRFLEPLVSRGTWLRGNLTRGTWL